MSTAIDQRATYVTDPLPTPPLRGAGLRCELKIHATPDVVEFCENPAAAVLAAPCCGQTTNVCSTCIVKLPGLGSWLCLGCGVKTDCRWTAMEFGIRWLT